MIIVALSVVGLFLIAALVLAWVWPLPVGTRSLLWGAHQFVLHPFFVALAWLKLYGFPRDLRIWCAFVVHDWGYWGLPNMDGNEGQRHPEFGGRLMAWAFGPRWGSFTRYHSRHYARLESRAPSELCAADKLALLVTPRWLYLPLVQLSGEADEYRALYARWKGVEHVTLAEWYEGLREHWADEVARLAPNTEWAILHRRQRRLSDGDSYAAKRAAQHADVIGAPISRQRDTPELARWTSLAHHEGAEHEHS